ncbi:hypothetical protein [Paraburkholderia sp. BCC1876]|uniref:hypothetical protein n=1 Tax=Paraburkholderia sp. BCC1876 TaxID=2676303 RepID=UPI0015914836|nr:hypothetical protein [Paraburkholderia sp. BCC1876]
MGTKWLLGVSVALVSFAGLLHPVSARADGPASAYGKGAADASLDPGEERMTADEENNARLKDLSDAYHNGYNARAKEDAETYTSLREQLKRPPKAAAAQVMPPLPEGMPGDEAAQVTSVQKPQIAQRALPAQPQPQPQLQLMQPQAQPQPQPQYRQAYQQPQYAPPRAMQYQPAPEYAEAQTYAEAPAYAEAEDESPQYQQPAYVAQAYGAPPQAPQRVEYVAMVGQPAYVPQPPPQVLVQPVMMVRRPQAYAGYRRAYWARPYRQPRPVRYGYSVQAADYSGWQ